MQTAEKLRNKLRKGRVYRREDLAQWSTAIDRHLSQLVDEGLLKKMAQGLYYVPKPSAFGPAPPDENEVISTYLKGDDFLLVSSNYYNSLGLGTTQLYNRKRVYNHKKHDDVKLGNKVYEFRRKPKFPKKLSREYLLVDLLNNLKYLAEDKQMILDNLKTGISAFNADSLYRNARRYGHIGTRKIIQQLL